MKWLGIGAAVLYLGLAARADAHSGGLDASGGHFDHRYGTYHYHGGGGGGFGGGGSFMTPDYSLPAYTYSRPTRTKARTVARTAPPRVQKRLTDASAPADDEKAANVKLAIARSLLEQGNKNGAIAYLNEIMEQHPGTEASREAGPLLARLNKSPAKPPGARLP